MHSLHIKDIGGKRRYSWNYSSGVKTTLKARKAPMETTINIRTEGCKPSGM